MKNRLSNLLKEYLLELQNDIDTTTDNFLKGKLKPLMYWDGALDMKIEVFNDLSKILLMTLD